MEDIYVIGHKSPDTDSVVSAIVYAGIKGYKAAVAGELNPETVFVLNRFGVPAPEVLSDAEGRKLVLVDHNQAGQMVANGDKAEIKEIIDHHNLVVSFGGPLFVHTEPVGATATVLFKLYPEAIKANPVWAGLVLSAILSDTVIFKSPTATDDDKAAVEALAPVCGIADVVSYGVEMKKTNSSIAGKPMADVVGADFKDFDMNGRKVGIGQTEVVDMSEVFARKDEILSRLNELKGSGYEMVIYSATDIINEGSEVFFAGDKAVIEKAFGVPVETDSSVYVKGLMSRKKQIVPPLEEVYKTL